MGMVMADSDHLLQLEREREGRGEREREREREREKGREGGREKDNHKYRIAGNILAGIKFGWLSPKSLLQEY